MVKGESKMNPEEEIIKKCYNVILKYCTYHLHGNIHAAEDCTQEVFLTLHQKIDKLDMSNDIRPWLYNVADKKIKEYFRKHPEWTDIDSIPELPDKSDDIMKKSILDVLDDTERQLAEDYYGGADKKKLAESQGITLNTLYDKMKFIRKKINNFIKNG